MPLGKSRISSSEDNSTEDGGEHETSSESGSENEVDASSQDGSVLFDKGTITGQSIFGFRTPKKRGAMSQKAVQSATLVNTPSPKTPKNWVLSGAGYLAQTPKTPRSTPKSAKGTPKSVKGTPKSAKGMPKSAKGTPKSAKSTPKSTVCTPTGRSTPGMPHTPHTHRPRIEVMRVNNTPYSLRTKVKKFLSEMAEKQLLDSSDISADESSYEVSSEDDGSESESGSTGEGVETCQSSPEQMVVGTPRQSARKWKDVNFIPATDDYFHTMSAKCITSNHTLRRLKNPRLAQEKVQELLGEVADRHKESLHSLSMEHCANFSKWMICLREGFSVMIYGVGSKRNLLLKFQEMYLSQETVLVVNGFFPSLTVKEILDSIVRSVLDYDWSGSTTDCLDLIEKEFRSDKSLCLYLIVNNLDGPALRTHKIQDVLARVAAIRNVYLLASIDHINAPLIWDQRKLSAFNFLWWDATTLLPYMAETSFETSLLGQQTGSLALSSLRNVFRSLTSNAREIFLLIARYQLTNKSNANYTGFAFRDLYRSCRENLLVSSDLALRAQLSEFLDHHLVKSRRSIDGTEVLTVPIENNILRQFVNQQAEEL